MTPSRRPTNPESDDDDPLAADAVLAAIPEPLYVVDRSRTIRYWNKAAEVLTGFTAAEVVGRRCRDGILNHVDEDGNQMCTSICPLVRSMADDKPRDDFYYLHHRDGHRIPVEVRTAPLHDGDGLVRGAVELFISEGRGATGRRHWEQRLAQAELDALTDELTGLTNRRGAQRALAELLLVHTSLVTDDSGRYTQDLCDLAVLFVDIDRFKAVNDTHGHPTGDRVLKAVAATLDRCARAHDVVARWGGEEFLVLAPLAPVASLPAGLAATAGPAVHAGRVAATTALAERLRRLVATAWADDDGRRIGVTVSIGAAVARPGETVDDVVARADAALMSAKATGRNRVVTVGPAQGSADEPADEPAHAHRNVTGAS